MKTEIMKRLRGWMALVLCMGILCGNSLMVQAAQYYFSVSSSIPSGLDAGTILTTSDEMKASGGFTYDITYTYGGRSESQMIDGCAENIQSYGGYTSWRIITSPMFSGGQTLKLTLKPVTGSDDEEKSHAGGESHKCSFEWMIMTEPTRTQDGLAACICRECGLVEATQPVTCWQFFMKQYRELLKNAGENATVTFEADDMPCISDVMLGFNDSRADVTMVILFNYDGVRYELTIPAGTDFSAVWNDTEAFYGYLGLAAKLGLTANVVS